MVYFTRNQSTRRPLTLQAPDACEICGGQRGTGTGLFIRVLQFSPVSNSTNSLHSLSSQCCPCWKDNEARPGKLQISTALLDIGKHWRNMYFHNACHCFVGDSSYNRPTSKKDTYFLFTFKLERAPTATQQEITQHFFFEVEAAV